MIVLDLPAEQQAIIEEKSHKERMTVEQYIIHKIMGSILSEKEKPLKNNVKKLKGIVKTDVQNYDEDSIFGFSKGDIEILGDIIAPTTTNAEWNACQ